MSLLPDQAAPLASREPDAVALQEVTAASLRAWREALPRIGLPHVRCSLDTADPARSPSRRRVTGVLLAAREPLTAAPSLPVPWPETALAADLDGVAVHTVHVPNAANGWVKVRTLEAIRAALAGGGPAVLCGDLNTPRRELPDGTGWRLDHLLARGLRAQACMYHDAWHDTGLSDHSALEADLQA